jgi:hypothetical protein
MLALLAAHAAAQVDTLLSAPDTHVAGTPLSARLSLGSHPTPDAYRVTLLAPDGHVLARREVSFDPSETRDPPGCDPMPGWTHPCSRTPLPVVLSVPFAGDLFTEPGDYRIAVRSQSGLGWGRVLASRVVHVARHGP